MPIDIANRRGIARRLSDLRKSAGYPSQRAFAEVVGVSGGIVGQWECGAKMPGRVNLLRIAELTGISVDYILGEAEGIPENLIEEMDREKELLRFYRAAPVQFRKNLVNMLRLAHLVRTEVETTHEECGPA